jgi:predicted ATP-dependent serine protease
MITIAFFTGEQTREALFGMEQRLDISDNIPGIYVGKNIQEIAAIIREKRPEIVIIDSIQTIGDGSNFPAYNDLKYISFMIRKLSRDYGCAFFVIGQVNHDNRQAGPTMLAHNFDVSIIMERGINDEVIVSTPTKNRVAPTGNRAVFRMTNNGLVAKSEMETGYILRYTEQSQIGMAAFMTKTNRDYSVDEITVTVGTESKKSGFTLDGSTKGHADFLVSIKNGTGGNKINAVKTR